MMSFAKYRKFGSRRKWYTVHLDPENGLDIVFFRNRRQGVSERFIHVPAIMWVAHGSYAHVNIYMYM